MSTILIFLIVIVALVVIHELGHFFVAKAFGIRVEEFGVGYPPRAKKMFTWKGTLFTLNWLPFGGFVKIYGEENQSENSQSSFAYQKLWKRVLVVLAGIAANMMLAIVLYALSLGIGFLSTSGAFPQSASVGPSQTIVAGVDKDSPASKSGLMLGDVITELSAAGKTEKPADFSGVVSFVKNHPSDAITFSIVRHNTPQTIVATPVRGAVGISLADVVRIKMPFWKAVGTAIPYTFKQFGFILASLKGLIVGSFGGGNGVLAEVSGPVGIAQVAGQAYALGFGSFLAFVALISVNLAVINLLPFPALDGGRCILECFSKNGRSRIPNRLVSAINQVSFLLLIIFMLYVTYHDIIRL